MGGRREAEQQELVSLLQQWEANDQREEEEGLEWCEEELIQELLALFVEENCT
jgi:hypothetical protein